MIIQRLGENFNTAHNIAYRSRGWSLNYVYIEPLPRFILALAVIAQDKLIATKGMAWNIAFMFVKADKDQINNIISDVLAKTKENMFFEDATSVSIG